METVTMVINTIKSINIFSVLDILVVSYLFYKAYNLMRETRAEQLLKGMLLLVLLIPISSLLRLNMLYWILSNTLTIGVLSMVIIFQPEIRRVLEHLGRVTFNEVHILNDEEKMDSVVGEVSNAASNLSKLKTGALIVIEQRTGLAEIVTTGTKIDAAISSALLENIFVVNTPLHDGAVIIRNDRIAAAGCFLPLTTHDDLSKSLGTRHRAALGISENSDCIVIVVSEETGTISLAVNGSLTRNYDKDKLKDILIRILKKRQDKKKTYREQVIEWLRKMKLLSR
ncbi:MAG: diadenylate cyclase CdaA [Clostridiaceae bacterium]